MALRRLLRRPSADSLGVAGVAARLAVFMQAGLSPLISWRQLVGDEEEQTLTEEMVGRIVDLLDDGHNVPDALAIATRDDDESWRVLAAVHAVAHQTGAPLGDALWALSGALAERDEVTQAVRQAIIAPVYTKRLLMALPLLGLATSWALGVDAIGFLTGSALGVVSLVVAALLLIGAERWSGHMIREAIPGPGYLSPALDLLGIASSGGASPEVARKRVEQALEDFQLASPDRDTVGQLTMLSRRVGVPLRALARAEASWSRARAKAFATEKAHALSVRILFPLGALVLPAFVLIAVVPVVFALLQGALSAGGTGLW